MAPNPAIPHEQIVKNARQASQALPPGTERAWRITNEVALQLQLAGEDAGLFAKTSGTNFNGYSIDRVCYRTGELFDILYDGEGEARPQWVFEGMVDPALWRAPVLIDPPPPPDPPPVDPPEPPDSDLGEVLARLDLLIGLAEADLEEVKQQTELLRAVLATVRGPLAVVQPVKIKYALG